MKYLDKIIDKTKPKLISLKEKIVPKVQSYSSRLLSRFNKNSSSTGTDDSSSTEDTGSSTAISTSSTTGEAPNISIDSSSAPTPTKSSDILSSHLDTIETEDTTENISALKKKKIIKYLGYGCAFIILFLFFFLMSFPYSILKETATKKLEEISGLSVNIEDVGLVLPAGIKLYNINFKSNDLSYTIKKIKVKLSFISLLFLDLKVSVDVLDSTKGSISIIIKEGMFRLLFSKNKLPSVVKVHTKNFSLKEVVEMLLSKLSSDSTMNPMIAPLMEEVYITGLLNTNINLDIASNPKNSSGSIIIKLNSASLGLKDPSLNVPEQKFEQANIKINMKNGEMVIDKDSKIESSDLSVGFDGKISLEEKIQLSNVNVNIPIKLKGALFNSYGFMLGGGSGSSTIMITGTFANLNTYQR